VDFFPDLSIGVIERAVEERHAVRVAEGPALRAVVGELSAARVTAPARLHLAARRSRRGPLRVARLRADRPRRALSLVERDGESFRCAIESSPVALLASPRDMVRSGAVAGLAGDVDLGIARGETPRRRVVVLPDAGRVALRAHVVPVLAGPRPVQLVAMGPVRTGIKMKPALAAVRARPRVPRDAQRLEPAIREFDEVLLQRRDSERVLDLVVAKAAVGTVGAHHESAVAAREDRGDTRVGEPSVIEIRGDAPLGGRLHGELVVRAAPAIMFLDVALSAELRSHVACGRRWLRPGERRRRPA